MLINHDEFQNINEYLELTVYIAATFAIVISISEKYQILEIKRCILGQVLEHEKHYSIRSQAHLYNQPFPRTERFCKGSSAF